MVAEVIVYLNVKVLNWALLGSQCIASHLFQFFPPYYASSHMLGILPIMFSLL